MTIKTFDEIDEIQEGTNLFLTEGESEKGFVRKILDDISNEQYNTICCFKGIKNFKAVLKKVSGSPRFEKLSSLFVMLGADNDLSERQAAIMSHFKNNGITLDLNDLKEGRVCRSTPCPIGIYISPGKQLNGTIEDMILEEIKEYDLYSCIFSYADCVKNIGLNLSKKSIVQSYISSKRGESCSTGAAFQAGVFDITHPAYETPRQLILSLLDASH